MNDEIDEETKQMMEKVENGVGELLVQLGKEMTDSMSEFRKEVNEWWDKLPYEDRLKAFHAVTNRIHEGELVNRGSYRHVLYDVFGFDFDAYIIGMDSGYIDIHNAIYDEETLQKILKDEREQAIEDYQLKHNIPQGAD